jgi:hypothetical protein
VVEELLRELLLIAPLLLVAELAVDLLEDPVDELPLLVAALDEPVVEGPVAVALDELLAPAAVPEEALLVAPPVLLAPPVDAPLSDEPLVTAPPELDPAPLVDPAEPVLSEDVQRADSALPPQATLTAAMATPQAATTCSRVDLCIQTLLTFRLRSGEAGDVPSGDHQKSWVAHQCPLGSW